MDVFPRNTARKLWRCAQMSGGSFIKVLELCAATSRSGIECLETFREAPTRVVQHNDEELRHNDEDLQSISHLSCLHNFWTLTSFRIEKKTRSNNTRYSMILAASVKA